MSKHCVPSAYPDTYGIQCEADINMEINSNAKQFYKKSSKINAFLLISVDCVDLEA